MGYLILIPWVLLGFICVKAINFSVGGGFRRIIGTATCLLLGGAMIGMGYWAAFIGWKEWILEGDNLVLYENTIPIAGWIGLLSGGFFTIIGSIWSALGKTRWKGEDTGSPLGITIFDRDTVGLEMSSSKGTTDTRCPKCGSEMVVRTAKKGPKAGHRFHVCIYYPGCKGKIPIRE